MEKDGTFELKDNLRDTLSDARPHGSSFSNMEPKSDHWGGIRTVDDEEEDLNQNSHAGGNLSKNVEHLGLNNDKDKDKDHKNNEELNIKAEDEDSI